MLNRGPDSLWSLKIPGCPSKKSRGETSASWPKFAHWPMASDQHGLLIIPIHRLASSLCLLSTNKLVCGGCSGTLWLPSHHSGGCCTLVVVEEIPPFYVKRFKCLEKCYINVTNIFFKLISLSCQPLYCAHSTCYSIICTNTVVHAVACIISY